MIQSREHTYEEVKKLDMGQKLSHYLCILSQGETGSYKHLIQNSSPDTFPEFLCFFASLMDNPAFTDLEEIIPGPEEIWLVFPYPQGKSLEEFIEGSPSLAARFQAGRAFLEAFILTMAPLEIIWDISDPGRIFIDPDAVAASGFLYELEDTQKAPSHTMKDVSERLIGVFRALFAPELDSHLYPEVEVLIGTLENEDFPDIMALYQEYAKLAPAALEERIAEPKKKKEHFLLVKKLAKHRLLFGTLLLAGLVLWAAANAGPYIWQQVVFPYIEAAYLVKTMETGSSKAAAYTGRVVLTDSQTGQAVFTGRLLEGRKEGLGRLYYSSSGSKEPEVLYDGYFQADRYEGEGTLYYRSGSIEYEGGFVKGRKEGEGTVCGRDGQLVYQGGFLNDLYEGQGVLYENRELIYEGGFHRGLYDGEGTRYLNGAIAEKGIYANGRLLEGTVTLKDRNGRIQYKGQWNDSGRSGQGTAYENGLRIYEGTFKNNVYDGEGTLYSPNTGGVIYEGSFSEGEFSGSGKLYEPGLQYLIYEGGFRLGLYDGQGKEYDEAGNLRYGGNFRLGIYHGSGTCYDPATGMVLEEGEFRNGILVTPKEQLEGGETDPEEAGHAGDANIDELEGGFEEDAGNAQEAQEAKAFPTAGLPPDTNESEGFEEHKEIGPGIGLPGPDQERS